LPAESIGKNAISPGARLAWKKPRGNSSAWRLIRSEQHLDGLYLLYTDLEAAQCAKEQVLGN
jgi:hypothetical protein